MDTVNHYRGQRHILVDCFLVCYNGLQILGWSCLFIHMVLFCQMPAHVLWQNLHNSLLACTSFLVLELLFCLLGITRSHPCSVFFLILSRLLLVWGVLMSSIPALHNAGLNLLILAWSTQELCRYLFYCLRVMDCLPYFVIWLRYSVFIILYPVGAAGELLCLYNAQRYFQEFPHWYLDLPQPWNLIFSYRTFLIFVMLLYTPVVPSMYLHLLSKRRRVLKRFNLSEHEIKSAQGLINA